MYRRIIALLVVIAIPFIVLAGCQSDTAKKPVPQKQASPRASAADLMELAGRDPYDKGCVSCHNKEADVDRSLPVYVKRIAGHPEVRESTVNACYTCHEPQKDYDLYVSFYRGVHKAHWESSLFFPQQKGQCYSCHTVETNGVSGIKEYPPAGYRSGLTGGRTTVPAPGPRAGQEKPKQPAPEKAGPSNERAGGQTKGETKGGAQGDTQGESKGETKGETGGATQGQSQEQSGSTTSQLFDEIPTPTP